jgi:hypothetical protein
MHKARLKECHRFTIRWALRCKYEQSMERLDLHESGARFYLEEAAEAWDAYRAFVGKPIFEVARNDPPRVHP